MSEPLTPEQEEIAERVRAEMCVGGKPAHAYFDLHAGRLPERLGVELTNEIVLNHEERIVALEASVKLMAQGREPVI